MQLNWATYPLTRELTAVCVVLCDGISLHLVLIIWCQVHFRMKKCWCFCSKHLYKGWYVPVNHHTDIGRPVLGPFATSDTSPLLEFFTFVILFLIGERINCSWGSNMTIYHILKVFLLLHNNNCWKQDLLFFPMRSVVCPQVGSLVFKLSDLICLLYTYICPIKSWSLI